MAEVLPGPGMGATHIGHDLELPHIDQLGGQQLPKRFLLVAKLSAHLLGWGQHWFSWGMITRTAAATCLKATRSTSQMMTF